LIAIKIILDFENAHYRKVFTRAGLAYKWAAILTRVRDGDAENAGL